MNLDPDYLRKHYSLLSDEALLAVDRADLVEMAQKILDEEVARRDLSTHRTYTNLHDDDAEADLEPPDDGDKPAWLDEAAEVYSVADLPGTGPDAANAHDVLEAAGISCYLDLYEIPKEKSAGPEPTHRWRLMVPGKLNLRATSVLERDIFNPDFEPTWKAHLESLSDEELRSMNPQVAFCGLFDRIERVNRVYAEEIARRKSE